MWIKQVAHRISTRVERKTEERIYTHELREEAGDGHGGSERGGWGHGRGGRGSSHPAAPRVPPRTPRPGLPPTNSPPRNPVLRRSDPNVTLVGNGEKRGHTVRCVGRETGLPHRWLLSVTASAGSRAALGTVSRRSCLCSPLNTAPRVFGK